MPPVSLTSLRVSAVCQRCMPVLHTCRRCIQALACKGCARALHASAACKHRAPELSACQRCVLFLISVQLLMGLVVASVEAATCAAASAIVSATARVAAAAAIRTGVNASANSALAALWHPCRRHHQGMLRLCFSMLSTVATCSAANLLICLTCFP